MSHFLSKAALYLYTLRFPETQALEQIETVRAMPVPTVPQSPAEAFHRCFRGGMVVVACE